MRESQLPIELASLSGKVHYVARVNSTEWSSSCPDCGGVPHKGGEFPDRFRMWTNATGKNKVIGWCRKCNYMWFPDGQRQMKAHEFEQWRKDALEAEQRRKAEAERAIALLKSEKIWLQFHARLNEWAYKVLGEWGINEPWAKYWRLGLLEDFTVFNDQGQYHSPAMTIPVWQLDSQTPANIKLRVLNPKNEKDRYRNYYKIGASKVFTAFPDLKSDTCILVEGEKKAMVTASRLGKDVQVMGIPTKTPSPESLEIMKSFGKIYVCLDPDARVGGEMTPQRRLVNLLGKERVLVVDLPDKIDDMVVQNKLSIKEALKYAKKVEA